MKKVFILSFAAFLLSFTAKADDGSSKASKSIESISDNTLRNFSYNFYKAADVKWSINDDYQKATFTLNGTPSYAIYDKSGAFLVATQTAKVSDLPERATKTLNTTYAGYRVNNAVKVLSRSTDFRYANDTDSYWVSLVNETEQVILLISPNAEISVVSSKKIAS